MILKQQKIFSNYLGWKQTKEFIAIIKDNKYRQLESMLEVGISERDIFVDKCSGKNFDRPQYQALKVQLREGDILVIKSIDRLRLKKYRRKSVFQSVFAEVIKTPQNIMKN